MFIGVFGTPIAWDDLTCSTSTSTGTIHPSLLTNATVSNITGAIKDRVVQRMKGLMSDVADGWKCTVADSTIYDGSVYVQINVTTTFDLNDWDIDGMYSSIQSSLDIAVYDVVSTPTRFTLARDDHLPYDVLTIQN